MNYTDILQSVNKEDSKSIIFFICEQTYDAQQLYKQFGFENLTNPNS
jgi:hypothetical protein